MGECERGGERERGGGEEKKVESGFFYKIFYHHLFFSPFSVQRKKKRPHPHTLLFIVIYFVFFAAVNGQYIHIQKKKGKGGKRGVFFFILSLARFARWPSNPPPTFLSLFSLFSSSCSSFPARNPSYRTSNAATLAEAILLALDPPFPPLPSSLPARFSFAAATPLPIAPPAPEAAAAILGCSSS